MKIPETILSPEVADGVGHMLATAIACVDYATSDDGWPGFVRMAETVCPEDKWGEPEREAMRGALMALRRMYTKLDHALGHPWLGDDPS